MAKNIVNLKVIQANTDVSTHALIGRKLILFDVEKETSKYVKSFDFEHAQLINETTSIILL